MVQEIGVDLWGIWQPWPSEDPEMCRFLADEAPCSYVKIMFKLQLLLEEQK
jgi:hypothetical protein